MKAPVRRGSGILIATSVGCILREEVGTVEIFGSQVAGVGGGGPDAAIAAKACTGVVGGRKCLGALTGQGGGGPFGLDFAAAGEVLATALGGVCLSLSL